MGLKKDKTIVQLFVNKFFAVGKKQAAEKALLIVLGQLKYKTNYSVSKTLEQVVGKIQPHVSLKTKKIAGVTYKIPIYLFSSKEKATSVSWLIDSSCGKKFGPRQKSLHAELVAAWHNEGHAIQKRKALHKLAVTNRAYLKYL